MTPSTDDDPLDALLETDTLREAVEDAYLQVGKQAKKLVPVPLEWNKALLDEKKRQCLRHLIAAADSMDELFYHQVWRGNLSLKAALDAFTGTAAETVRHYYEIMAGPFDRLAGFEPFLGSIPHPTGAGYYPPSMTKEAFNEWLEAHPDDADAFESHYTLINYRDEDPSTGELVAVPYPEVEAYRPLLRRAQKELKMAANHCANESLRKFLLSRGEAFFSNDYYVSDCDWMDVCDNLIDVTIGPYEVYEDGLFNYKAAFEAFICLKDPDASAELAMLEQYLPDLEAALPIPDEHKNPDRGFESPITVADEVYVAGDTRAGVQTLAFNLPNDERVREAKGSKKVILRNVMHAKYDGIFIPIANVVLEGDAVKRCSFDAFFRHTLMHEMGHGLGPGRIEKDGEKIEVARTLRDRYTAIEEAKADTLGMYCNSWLINEGILENASLESVTTTFLGGIFRSIRFGVHEAHGQANVIILNYLLEHGGYLFDPETNRFGVDHHRVLEAVRDLAHDLLMIEAMGDYDAAGAFIEEYGTLKAEHERVLGSLATIPIDIEPVFDLDF